MGLILLRIRVFCLVVHLWLRTLIHFSNQFANVPWRKISLLLHSRFVFSLRWVELASNFCCCNRLLIEAYSVQQEHLSHVGYRLINVHRNICIVVIKSLILEGKLASLSSSLGELKTALGGLPVRA